MPFARPALSQLRARIGAAYRARFPGADTNLRSSPDRGIVEIVAASTDEDLTYLDWQVLQLFPFSAETAYLERWAAWKGVFRKPSSVGLGVLTLTGAVGRTAPAGTTLQTEDGTVTVALANDATTEGDGTVDVQAAAIAGGIAGNLGEAATLTFVGTPPGFADSATVSVSFTGGAPAESDAQLRIRTARAYAQPSFGGNRNDWEQAALAVPGVARVYTASATPTPGAVTIWPLFDGIRENGIPVGTDAWFRPGTGVSAGIGGVGDQRLVLDAILAMRPVCANVYVSALATHAIDVTISNLTNDTPAVRTAIATELTNMLPRRASPAGKIWRSWVAEAVSRAAGEDSHDLTAPAGDTTIDAGTIAVLGAVTFA